LLKFEEESNYKKRIEVGVFVYELKVHERS